ncbi:prephenate dehydrogenase/arogenate dehydrogenase family protein [Candidatus Pelagibacter sp.]|nr:prephenate dehydrogenase/arogenate dehydrogenase family protein [Candidatus Pelagibacter sp.]|tara:strand:- start:143 stop:1024 length:882 start_codon:yes stop_codon:yes gene_type:complete
MFKNTLIIGCGLIGSSILRSSIKNKISKNFYVFEKSKKNKQIIKKINSKIIFVSNLNKDIDKMNFIIICTPMSEYKFIIPKINKLKSENYVVTEVGSTKRNLINLIKNKNFVLSHPIAGSEVSGPKFSDQDLFNNKWCIIINKGKRNKINLVKKFWRKIGSKVILMDAKNHDKIFAITSHLPHLIAYNLIKTAQDFQKNEKKNLIKYSAGGLRDFSRTAASNEIMWRDIFFNNKDNMIKSIDKFIKNLNLMKKNIKLEKDKELKKILINSKKVRKQIITLKQDVSKPNFGRNI